MHHTPRVRAFFFSDSNIVTSAKTGYFSPQELNNQPNAPQKSKENQRVASYALVIRMARKPLRYVIYKSTSAHTNFSGRGGRYTDFLCKKQYIAITANRRQDKVTDLKIQSYSYHENAGAKQQYIAITSNRRQD